MLTAIQARTLMNQDRAPIIQSCSDLEIIQAFIAIKARSGCSYLDWTVLKKDADNLAFFLVQLGYELVREDFYLPKFPLLEKWLVRW